MEIVTILWSIGGTVALTLAVTCGLVWLIERRDRSTLMLCILGFATAASAYCELGLMNSATTAEYGEWLRWYHPPVGAALVAMLLFVHVYLGTGRVWLLWPIILARVVILLINFSVQPNFNFSSIESLRFTSLFGEQVSAVGVAVPRAWQWLAMASFTLMLAYLVDAVVRCWHNGGRDARRKVIAVGVGITVPLFGTIIYTQLLVFGFLSAPVSSLPWFLGSLLVMASELGRDFVVSRRERLELAELRLRLAHADRVNVMAQLATTLAHELTQPLAATAANVIAARTQLKRGNADPEELDAILEDIYRDEHRASEIIKRMRELFKRRTIEMQPISVEDVVADAMSLIHSEATSKRVALRTAMQPNLPQVWGDRVHLSQVFLNLLMNSIQAVMSRPVGSRRIVVEARTLDVNAEVEIAVRDSGPGIPDDISTEIFKPFFTTKSEGMGMGLALSRTIVEACGGHMWVDRTSQEGAVVRFTLRRVAQPEPKLAQIPGNAEPETIRTLPTSA